MTGTTLTPPNGIILIFDLANPNFEVPEYRSDQLASANRECVFVGTRAYVDGETHVRLVGSLAEVDKAPEYKVSDGAIDAPSRKIRIMTVELVTILECPVKDITAKVAIWADDLRNPGQLLVVVE
jgi:hypothetical protein